MPVSRESVVWAFRLILGREPESEAGLQAHQRLPDESAVVAHLLASAEFKASARFKDLIEVKAGHEAVRRSLWQHDTRAAWKSLVFGNCQSQTIGKLLQAMTGDVETKVFETTPAMLRRMQSGEFDIGELLHQADLVFVQAVGEVTELVQRHHPHEAHKLRQLPRLSYSGFHPDIVYIRHRDRHLAGPMGEYHSSIVFWAWRAGLGREQAVQLFRPEVYEHLGFAAHHQAGYQALIEMGRMTQLSMAPLIDGWNRRGCWMHTVNHPTAWALADVVAAALRREGIQPLNATAAWVDDPLLRWPVWPVYPGIAEARGLEGNFSFKVDQGECPPHQPILVLDLEAFVDAAYKRYERTRGEPLSCARVDTAAYGDLMRFTGKVAGPWRRWATRLQGLFRPAPPEDPPVPVPNQPYEGLPDSQFWRRAVAAVDPADLDPVVETAFRLAPTDRVATAGSCFAQHIARTLQRERLHYFVVDRPEGMDDAEAQSQGFGLFSARYGNIYTSRQLVQLFDRAQGDWNPLDDAWQRADGRWVDPFRPQVHAAGFDSAPSVRADTAIHLAQVRRLFAELDVFIFTLGLTECWRSRIDGAVYPLAPGVAAGRFDPARHEFVNLSASDVEADLDGFIQRLRSVNPRARVLLTVSPVPLIATFGSKHVLPATVHSKAVLRTAAQRVVAAHERVDYFPSFEIVTGAASRGRYFESDLRAVTPEGVSHVMRVFMAHYGPEGPSQPVAGPPAPSENSLQALQAEQRQVQGIVCDEEAIERHRR